MPTHSNGTEPLSVETHLDCISGIVHRLCCRRRLGADNEDDFLSYVMVRLLENDQAVLRRFEGRSSARTYLYVVVERLLLDWQTARWGRWRPTARARRAGPDAVALERMVVRDGWTIGEAIEHLARDPRLEIGRDRLEAVAKGLRFRPRVFMAGEEAMPVELEDARLPSPSAALESKARRLAAEGITRALNVALDALDPEDRVLIRLRYRDGFRVKTVATRLGYDPRALYRHYARLNGRLRRELGISGISWNDVQDLMGGVETDIQVDVLKRGWAGSRSAAGEKPEEDDEDRGRTEREISRSARSEKTAVRC